MLSHKTAELVGGVSEPIVILVEGKGNLELATKMLKLTFGGSLPEGISFIGVVANQEEVDPVKELLSSQFGDCPERLIGVVARGESEWELCSNVLTALVGAFPPSDLSTSSQS